MDGEQRTQKIPWKMTIYLEEFISKMVWGRAGVPILDTVFGVAAYGRLPPIFMLQREIFAYRKIRDRSIIEGPRRWRTNIRFPSVKLD